MHMPMLAMRRRRASQRRRYAFPGNHRLTVDADRAILMSTWTRLPLRGAACIYLDVASSAEVISRDVAL
jgi:hypothetical protein